jgi:hypothetical protein
MVGTVRRRESIKFTSKKTSSPFLRRQKKMFKTTFAHFSSLHSFLRASSLPHSSAMLFIYDDDNNDDDDDDVALQIAG